MSGWQPDLSDCENTAQNCHYDRDRHDKRHYDEERLVINVIQSEDL